MKKMFAFALHILILSFPLVAFGQLNLVSGTISTGMLLENEAVIEQNFQSVSVAIDIPLDRFLFRGEYSYFFLNEPQDGAIEIDDCSAFRAYVGYSIGQGNRVQFPVYLGASKYSSSGDISIDDWGVSLRSECRFYVTQKIAIFGGISYDYILPTEQSYTNTMNMPVVSELAPRVFALNIGVAYSYLKSD